MTVLPIQFPRVRGPAPLGVECAAPVAIPPPNDRTLGIDDLATYYAYSYGVENGTIGARIQSTALANKMNKDLDIE